jgi:hypothetical protein
MLSLYQLLFSKRYWRSISLRAVWREAGLSLRRAHKDPRARKLLFQLLLLVITPLLCVVYFAWLVSSGAIFFVPFVIPAIWWIRRSHKRNEPLQIAPQSESRSVPVDEDNPAIRGYLGQMGVLYAAMLDRAGSESFLRGQELPPNIKVISRRTHIDLMRRTGIWDKMEIADREAMMIADGHWGPELIARTSIGMEPLRLLRWILRIDYFLPAIGRNASPSYAMAHDYVAVQLSSGATDRLHTGGFRDNHQFLRIYSSNLIVRRVVNLVFRREFSRQACACWLSLNGIWLWPIQSLDRTSLAIRRSS